jgi:hypothetical protein
MKYILLTTMISLFSMNTFALGEKPSQDLHCCTPCGMKLVGGQCVKDDRNAPLVEKREASNKPKDINKSDNGSTF